MNTEITPENFTRQNSDSNGNPRYATRFLNLLTEQESDSLPRENRYSIAMERANKLGGRKYNNKKFGGGIVFQSYNLDHLCEQINKELNPDYGKDDNIIRHWLGITFDYNPSREMVLIGGKGALEIASITNILTSCSDITIFNFDHFGESTLLKAKKYFKNYYKIKKVIITPKPKLNPKEIYTALKEG